MYPIEKNELIHAQMVLLLAIVLQLSLSQDLVVGPKFLIAGLELLLVFSLGFTAPKRHTSSVKLHRTFATTLIGLVSLVNSFSLILVINALIHGDQALSGISLLTSAVAIYFTNIIMFGLWYWEIDSPGLTGYQHFEHKPGFLFPQSNLETKEARQWRPTFLDYLYISVTNGTAFSPTDTLPLTHRVKILMSAQALVSLLTIGLVAARAVNILA